MLMICDGAVIFNIAKDIIPNRVGESDSDMDLFALDSLLYESDTAGMYVHITRASHCLSPDLNAL